MRYHVGTKQQAREIQYTVRGIPRVEMRVALDTSRITDLFRGDLALAEQLGTAEEGWIPLIARGEIKAGFHGGTQQRRNESLLNMMLAKPTVGVLFRSTQAGGHACSG